MQKFKLSFLSAAVGAALLFSSGAEACTLNAWTVNGSIVGSPIAGGPAHTNNTVRRYSGICGMRASAAGDYVQNDDPAADQIFRARFYVFTGLTSGSATVFQAGNSTNDNEIEVIVNRGTNQLQVRHRGGTPVNFSINPAGRWYSVEVAMNSTNTDTTGADPIPANTMLVRVSGANTGVSDVVNSQSLTVTNGATIDFARLGWVSGTATGNLDFDAYESTRSAGNPIGRLCRGDANGSNTITVADRSAITAEMNNPANAATGQPDCNEDGQITAADRSCVTGLLSASATCN